MDLESSLSGISSSDAQNASSTTTGGAARQKRTRVLLSCAPCRFSKLKCDRESPCGQCQKKGREDLCQYAPKPEKRRPAKSMAARLKRLEGMVRGMMDADGNVMPQPQGQEQKQAGRGDSESPHVQGQVFKGSNKTTYVGATHCMAMLEDVSCLFTG